MITAQFDATGGNGTGMAVKDLVKGDIPVGAEMQVRRPEGDYDIYTYSEMAFNPDFDPEDPSTMTMPGWADGSGSLATSKVSPGAAFWLKADTACDVTIAGSILAEASKTVNVNAGIFSMVGNAYPADVNPNDVTWTGLTNGDEMQVRLDVGDYDIYTYSETAFNPNFDPNDPSTMTKPGWADGTGSLVTTAVLKSGRGAWIKPAAAASVTWESPIQ